MNHFKLKNGEISDKAEIQGDSISQSLIGQTVTVCITENGFKTVIPSMPTLSKNDYDLLSAKASSIAESAEKKGDFSALSHNGVAIIEIVRSSPVRNGERSVKVKLTSEASDEFDRLKERLGAKDDAEAINFAYSLMKWAIDEIDKGRLIASIDEKTDDVCILDASAAFPNSIPH